MSWSVESRPKTHDRQALVGAMWGLVAALVLVLGVPLSVYVATPDARYDAWVWCIPVLVLSGVRLAWLIGRAERRLFDLTVAVFFYFFLGLAPLAQSRSGIFPGTTPDVDPTRIAPALGLTILALLSYFLGYAAAPQRQSASSDDAPPLVNVQRANILAVVALVVGSYYVAAYGLGPRTVAAPEVSEGAEGIAQRMVKATVSMTLLVAFVALAHVRRAGTDRTSTRLQLMVTAAIVLLLNPVTVTRYVFGTVAMAMAAALGAFATRNRFRITAAVTTAAMLFVFPIADAFRYGLTPALKANSPVSALLTGDFDAFPQIMNTLVYVDRHGDTDGMQALGVLLFWVPRMMWPEKPVDTGILLADDRGYDFTNLSAPLPAEFMVNYGWAAVGIGMALFGVACRLADEWVMNAIRLHSVPGLLGCIIPAYLFLVLRGSLLQAMAYLSVILVSSCWVSGPRPVRHARR